MTKVVLVSGGVDSMLVGNLLARRGEEFVPLFVDYGQPYADVEGAVVEDLFRGVRRVTVSGLPIGDGHYVPARNLMLATFAARFGPRIYLGGMRDDNCPDKTPQALLQMSRILSDHCGYAVAVESPFWDKSKAEAIHEYLMSGGSKERLLQTFSCYTPVGGEACFDCNACLRWSVAMQANGIYAELPSRRLLVEYLGKMHEYDSVRSWTLVEAAKKKHRVFEVKVTGDMLAAPPSDLIAASVRRASHSGAIVVVVSPLWEVYRRRLTDWLGDIPHDAIVMGHAPWRQ